jgi:serine/threonine protein kinase
MKTVHRTGRETDFVREVSILQHCSHPNIVRLVGLVEVDKKVEVMLIGYIEDVKLLPSIISISAEECKKWTRQINDAVEYLHQKGLMWGDAKAANVLVGKDGNAVLIEFGSGYADGWVDAENHDTAGAM